MAAYNRRQIEEESSKTKFLSVHPELQEALFRLEDQTLIRGCTASFDLDPSTFARRSTAFRELFEDNTVSLQEVGAALLACGDYSRGIGWGRFQFGSPTRRDVWRQLFTSTASKDFSAMKDTLMRMLDALEVTADAPIRARVRHIVSGYLDEQERAKKFDWRYYLVKYPEMREGDSGIYVGSEGKMGFGLCMLYGVRLNGRYRDPYLYTIFKRSGVEQDRNVEDPWHRGYETVERSMTLVKSGVRLTSRMSEFGLSEPSSLGYHNAFAQILRKHNVDASLSLQIPQAESGGVLYDTVDRVQVGAELLRDLARGMSEPVPETSRAC